MPTHRDSGGFDTSVKAESQRRKRTVRDTTATPTDDELKTGIVAMALAAPRRLWKRFVRGWGRLQSTRGAPILNLFLAVCGCMAVLLGVCYVAMVLAMVLSFGNPWVALVLYYGFALTALFTLIAYGGDWLERRGNLRVAGFVV